MKQFLSCDWGTSSFRLRLVDASNLAVIASVKSTNGIAATYQSWKRSERAGDERVTFFLDYLGKQVAALEAQNGSTVGEVPVVLSGMASSTIGMIDLPYCSVPYSLDGPRLVTKKIRATDNFPFELLLISGVSSADDVMRGEETMLAGCDEAFQPGARMYIFPGTHSKHVLVENGVVKGFHTFMTGELFEALSTKTVLAASVDAGTGLNQNNTRFFEQGVVEGSRGNLANSLFHVRTNQVFNKLAPADNYQFLSGLLIGNELRGLSPGAQPVTLVTSGGLKDLYLRALDLLARGPVGYKDSDEALIAGQARILAGDSSW